MKSFPTASVACWNRASSAWGLPRAMDAAPSARRSTCPARAATGPRKACSTKERRWCRALGSVLDVGDYKGLTDEQINEKIDAAIDTLPYLAGAFYKYSLASSLLGGKPR